MDGTTRKRVRVTAAVVAATAVTLVTGCQPAGDPAAMEPDAVGEEVAAEPAVPSTLDDLVAETDPIAAEWQDDARAVEALIRLNPDGQASRARVTYLAPDADRFLTVEIDEDGTSQERPTLATLGLAAIDEDALAAVPPVPEGTPEAESFAEAAAPVLEDCGLEPPVDTVLYATGAPAAWDGERWADELEWTATASATDGGAVVLEPVDATPAGDDPCVPPTGA